MNTYCIQYQAKPRIRGAGFLSLLLGIILLMTTAAFAQPTAPILVLPDSGAVNQPHQLSLIWNTSDTADSYHLQVSDTVSFTTTVFNETGLADTSQFVEMLDFSTTYYWRVAAAIGSTTGEFSKINSFTTWAFVPAGPDLVELGLVESFAILAYAAVTNVPLSAIKGDVGLTPTAGSFIDLTLVEVTGTIYAVDATGPSGSVVAPTILTTAKGDLTTAFNDAAGRTVDPIGIAGNIGGQTLLPGLYKSTGTLEISSGDLTLDGFGNEDAVWIFQVASSFNMSTSRKVILTNGANARNIFWQVGTAAIFGTTSNMAGTVMAGTQVTMAQGATLDGRALALEENVTLQQNSISVPDKKVDTAIDDENGVLPGKITLSQNYPNPFNPSTTIRYGLVEASVVRLEVFDILGQHVATLVDGQKVAGFHTSTFDASQLSSGIYTYRLTANENQLVRRMSLIK